MIKLNKTIFIIKRSMINFIKIKINLMLRLSELIANLVQK